MNLPSNATLAELDISMFMRKVPSGVCRVIRRTRRCQLAIILHPFPRHNSIHPTEVSLDMTQGTSLATSLVMHLLQGDIRKVMEVDMETNTRDAIIMNTTTTAATDGPNRYVLLNIM